MAFSLMGVGVSGGVDEGVVAESGMGLMVLEGLGLFLRLLML